MSAGDVGRAVAEAIGADRVVTGGAELATVARDMGEPPPLFDRLLCRRTASLVVRPRDADELAAAVACLAGEGVPFTPRGIGSCGLGGAVPVAGGALLDLSGMSGVVALDDDGVEVRAGSTFYFIESRLRSRGLALPSRPTNAFGTIGGWAAAGGLGLGSLEVGPIGDQVTRLDVVRPDGSADRLTPSDSDFHDLFDTEGQLGIIAGLTLRVRRRAPHRLVGLVLPDLEAAQSYVAKLLDTGARPRTAVLPGPSEELVEDTPHGEVLLLECARGTDLPELDKPGAHNLAPALTAHLWRRRFFPMDNGMGPLFLASEALLPLTGAAAFVERARKVARRFGVPLHAHCHTVRAGGDPELLVLLLFPADPRQGWHHLMLTPLAAVLTSMAAGMGGRPYGVGIWNTPFAADHFGAARYRELAERKRTLDPEGLLNPGKFFRVGTEALALPAVMKPAVYGSSLGLAAHTTPWLMRRHDPSDRPSTTADRCVSCGACVPVCPAVAATGCETVSARAKLGLVRRLAAGEAVAQEELLGAQRCLKCGQCAEVCARGLALVETWDELETATRAHPVDTEALEETIRTFAEEVDARAERVLDVALP